MKTRQLKQLFLILFVGVTLVSFFIYRLHQVEAEKNLNIISQIKNTDPSSNVFLSTINTSHIPQIEIQNLSINNSLGVISYQNSAPLSAVLNNTSYISFDFVITNKTNTNQPLLKFKTGIKKGQLNDIHVIGATGYEWVDNQLTVGYISLLPNSSLTVTITGLPLISTSTIQYRLKPVLFDENKRDIYAGVETTRSVNYSKFFEKNGFNMGQIKK